MFWIVVAKLRWDLPQGHFLFANSQAHKQTKSRTAEHCREHLKRSEGGGTTGESGQEPLNELDGEERA